MDYMIVEWEFDLFLLLELHRERIFWKKRDDHESFFRKRKLNSEFDITPWMMKLYGDIILLLMLNIFTSYGRESQ